MKLLFVFLMSLPFIHSMAASDEGNKKPVTEFEVIPLNSPIKEAHAKFLFKTPIGFEVSSFKYVVKQDGKVYEKNKLPSSLKLIDGPQGKELHFRASQLAPGTYKLFVKIRDKWNREYQLKNQHKDHAVFAIDDSLEVADPGEEGMKTLEGISGRDGIRDDVQRWIAESAIDIDKKNALKQFAKGYQKSLIESKDKEKSIQNIRLVFKAMYCSRMVGGEDFEIKYGREIEAKMLNTKDRLIADSLVNEHFKGHSSNIRKPSAEDCEFVIVNSAQGQ